MRYVFCLILALYLFPMAVKAEDPPKPDPSLRWHKYNSKNFEVLGINETDAAYLSANLENIKSWILSRWGFPDIQFSVPCRIVCVSDKETFKSFFGREPQCYRIQRDKNGFISEMVIWLNLEGNRWNVGDVPRALTEICLQQSETKTGKLGFWAHRGMTVLNGDFKSIRSHIGMLNQAFVQDTPIYWSKEILLMDEAKLANNSAKSWYDAEAAVFCLMLYKEFGPIKFKQFLVESQKDPEAAIKSVYGFSSLDAFDSSFKHYVFNLSSDVVGKGQEITPNQYFTWDFKN